MPFFPAFLDLVENREKLGRVLIVVKPTLYSNLSSETTVGCLYQDCLRRRLGGGQWRSRVKEPFHPRPIRLIPTKLAMFICMGIRQKNEVWTGGIKQEYMAFFRAPNITDLRLLDKKPHLAKRNHEIMSRSNNSC